MELYFSENSEGDKKFDKGRTFISAIKTNKIIVCVIFFHFIYTIHELSGIVNFYRHSIS